MLTTNPQIEIEAETLARMLIECPAGDMVSYADLTAAIGRDVSKTNARLALLKARKKAEQHTGALYATVRQEGVKRLLGEHVAGIGAETRGRIRRTAKRTYERLTAQKYNSLTKEDRQRIDAERSLLGAIATLSQDATAKKVLPGTSTGPVPIGQIVGAIG